MENNNKTKEKESTLEHLCALGTGAILGGFHSMSMYHLMDKARLYDPSYHVLIPIAYAASLGTASLLFSGVYVGTKLFRLNNKLRARAKMKKDLKKTRGHIKEYLE